MHRNKLLIVIGIILAVFAVAAVACNDDDDGDSSDGDGDATSVPTRSDEDPDILRLSVTLTGTDEGGPSGEADISVNDDGILVSVTLLDLPEGAHANHLHHGTCAEPGEIHITLDQIVGDGTAGSQTTANNEEAIDQIAEGHFLAVHEGENDAPGAIITCGDVVAAAE